MQLLVLFFSFFVMLTGSINGQSLISKVYKWDELPEKRSLTGKQRNILEGQTETLEYLEVHASTFLAGSRRAPVKHIHPHHEELIIVKEGVVEATLNGNKVVVKAGGIILLCQNDQHTVVNGSRDATTYYIFRWKARNVLPPARQNAKSEILQWDDIPFVASAKGGRRNIMQRATSQLAELEIHTTMLNENLISHAAHTHPDDEFILVKSGTVEETINGKGYTCGPGSLIFLKGTDNHAIRNAGKGQCEYYAIRFK